MKLTKQQTDMIVVALRTMTSPEADQLCEVFSARDVWAVPPNTIESLREHFVKLDELHAQLRETTDQYIAQVQKKCGHHMQFSQASKRWVCKLCGKNET